MYPGVCNTDIKRHMGVDKSITGNIIASPILWLLTRSPARGAQTVLWAATDPDVATVTGKLFSNMQVDILQTKSVVLCFIDIKISGN